MRRTLMAVVVCVLVAGIARAGQLEVMLQEGRYQHVQGRLTEAAFDYRMALKSDIFAAEPHLDLGVALYQLGRSTEAAAEFREALKSGSKDPLTQVMLGLAASDGKESREAYRQAVAVEPAYGAPGFDPDEVLLKRKLLPAKAPRTLANSRRWASLALPEAAPAPLDAATPGDPSSPITHANLGNTLYKQAQDPALPKDSAATLRKLAAVEYKKAASQALGEK